MAYLLMTGGTVDQLKKMQMEFQEMGFEVEELINAPLSQYNKRTAIHLAAYNGLPDCLELLLKSGGHPNAVSSSKDSNQTPLHLAVIKGSPKCIKILLEYGAKMDIKNSHLETPFDLVEGKKSCEKEFQNAIVKNRIPSRNEEQQQRVKSLHSRQLIGFELFSYFYQQLPPDHTDLATRWTDYNQQTLLYRLEHYHNSLSS
jgi:uncharacterized protein YggL (DUF469 family)